MALKRFQTKDIAVWIPVDSAIVLSAYTVAFFARSVTAPLAYSRSFPCMVLASLLTIGALYGSGAYRRIWSQTSGHDVAVIVRAVLLAAALTTLFNLLSRAPWPLPLSVILIGHTITLMGLVAVRYRSRLITGLSWRWRAIWHHEFPPRATRVLIVGAGEAGRSLALRLRRRSGSNGLYQVIGFVDDDVSKQGLYIEGGQVLGGRDAIPALAAARAVDLIVIAIHKISGPGLRQIISYCEQTDARIKVVPDTLELLGTAIGAPLLRDLQPHDILGRRPLARHSDVDFAPVTGKVVLVTGAAGTIGAELSHQLLAYEPVRLIALDFNESGLYDLKTALVRQATCPVEVALVDVTNRVALRRVFEHYRPQVVFHAAAYKHVPMLEAHPEEAIRVNIGGTLCVAELAQAYRVERLVFISTDKAVQPSSVMGASKRAGELLIAALAQTPPAGAQTHFAAVRFGNVFASRGSVVPTFESQISAGGPVTVTARDVTRFFMTVPDAVNLVIHAACLTAGNSLFMLNMGEEVRILDLAERMIRARGLRPYVDIPIEIIGMREGEKLHEQLYYAQEHVAATAHPDIWQLMVDVQVRDARAYISGLAALVQQLDALAYGSRTAAEWLGLLNDYCHTMTAAEEAEPVPHQWALAGHLAG